MRGRPEFTTLRTNRQVYQEAKTVMLKGNQFIRVRMHGVFPLQLFFVPHQIPAVTFKQEAISKCKHYVMTHIINITFDPKIESLDNEEYLETIILREDLDLFLKALADAEILCPDPSLKNKHRITLHNPFGGTLSPNFTDCKNQKHLHGFKNFQIDGKIEPEVAKTISNEIKEDSPPNPQRLIKWVTLQKELGNGLYREISPLAAGAFWGRASRQVERLAHCSHWALVKAVGGEPFEDKFTALFFQLSANSLQGIIEIIPTCPPPEMSQYAAVVSQLFHVAGNADRVLGTKWTPDSVQLAKLHYRLAMIYRLADHDAMDA
ncbi:hypothetical protein TSTA_004000 [Talaromyces stipitatus ATCC 10500]|uniref:Uncharacterized protein n=1 Tax=Talaromyces stipitatus (strain ATCC 10500 / CBS 375.48 / QM 6759 / NRRL 1006) TaxID=441959 RepID=B8MSM0_TALSN|nr:uncharacterized protein TSTA_004000 [Talaromyces stipitatus ATCC 10500]EED12348.1 hypothetical protein TSTA_004000 [Talaromyces stipitatus ATCC 10500]